MNKRIAYSFKQSSRTGFTLIEILLVISIVAILSTIGMVSYMSAVRQSRNTKRVSDIEQIRAALEIFRTDKGHYPEEGDGSWRDVLNLESYLVTTDRYMPAIPVDPKGETFAPYQYIATDGSGTPIRYYGYCLAALFEQPSTDPHDDTCGITLPSSADGDDYNYARENP